MKTPMILIRPWVLGLFPALLVACGDRAVSLAMAEVRDSAGVRIVESTVGMWQEGDAWTVAPTPRVDIGGVEGDPTQQLFGVGDAHRLPDGRIVVANYGSQELLFYDPDGAHLLTAGGRGGGPGEFQAMGGIEVWHDSLVVTNRQPPTLAFYDLGGRFVRSRRYQSPPVGLFADGTVLAAQTNFLEDPKDGMIRPPSVLLRFSNDGESVDTLRTVGGNERYMTFSGQSISVMRLPFGRATWTLVRGNRFYVADNDRYEIGVYGSDGTLHASIRKSLENLVATEADMERFIEIRLRGAGDDERRRRAAQAFRDVPMPETFPAFGWNTTSRTAPVLIDDTDHLWVLEYNRPGDEEYRWSVFDPEGRLLGEVVFPVVLEPMHIGDDFVLGEWRDEFDVEHVRLYDLIKQKRR